MYMSIQACIIYMCMHRLTGMALSWMSVGWQKPRASRDSRSQEGMCVSDNRSLEASPCVSLISGDSSALLLLSDAATSLKVRRTPDAMRGGEDAPLPSSADTALNKLPICPLSGLRREGRIALIALRRIGSEIRARRHRAGLVAGALNCTLLLTSKLRRKMHNNILRQLRDMYDCHVDIGTYSSYK